MTRVFNEATSFKEEMIEGFVAAYGRFVRRVPNASGVMAVGAPTPGKVSDLTLEVSLDMLKRLGGAEPGDKTMIDALKPFVRWFSGAAEGGSGTSDAWSRALPAASEGAEAPSGMVSTKGRSSKLGERSRGHKDPGAASMVLVLSAAGEALAEESKQEASRQSGTPGSEEGKA